LDFRSRIKSGTSFGFWILIMEVHMRKYLVLLAVFAFLAMPAASQAIEVAVGLNNTAFSDDADALDSDNGKTLDVTLGGGMTRLMFSLIDAKPSGADYSAWMVGPVFVLDAGFDFRVYALYSDHELDAGIGTWEGNGTTLGGGFGIPVFPMAEVAGDVRVSKWDADGDDIGTATISLLFRLEL
jgi:hypothetical protein